jgi:hypothetical protein
MDSQATLRTYGNTKLPEGTRNRPLVTFAVVTYNQEKYIREAVQGAFSQTYSPLEIILSDDCSNDRTFEIIEEMARDYDGPHLVKVRRGATNLGPVEHGKSVVDLSGANFIVFAAGDDISLPHRTTKIAKIFIRNPDIYLVHSNVTELSEDGRRGASVTPPFRDGSDILSIAKSFTIYIGATGAINRQFSKAFKRTTEAETHEDLTLGFRAALLGGLHHIDEDLVLYRTGIGISSEYARKIEPLATRRMRLMRHRIATLRQREIDLTKLQIVNTRRIDKVISMELEYTLARLTYHASPQTFIIQLLRRPRFCYWKATFSETKYILASVISVSLEVLRRRLMGCS